MAYHSQRRRSSWFGPQFKFESFSLPGLGSFPAPRQLPPASQHGSFALPQANYNYQPRRSSNLKPVTHQAQRIQCHEPLFQDSYILAEDEISPSAPDPRQNYLWEQDASDKHFAPIIASETLEDFGLAAVINDDTEVLATYVSIMNLGKPKVVDIQPPNLSRQTSPKESPRVQTKASLRPPIVWRMPSYDSSSTMSDSISYAESGRSESFDSHSTYPSSFSDSPKTPDSFSDSGKLEIPMSVSANFSQPPRHGSISRSTTLLRRHSRNLSASFSKAFLTRLKDADASPPPSSRGSNPIIVEPKTNYSMPFGAHRRPDTPDSFVTNEDLHINPQLLAPLSRKAPVLRRKKSIAGIWF